MRLSGEMKGRFFSAFFLYHILPYNLKIGTTVIYFDENATHIHVYLKPLRKKEADLHPLSTFINKTFYI